MRATKAYIAGIGTTGVLLASSIALLLFVSALVGFDAWPGGTLGERVQPIEVRAGEEPVGLADALAADPLPAAAGAIALAPAGAGPAGGDAPGTGTPPVLGDNGTGGAPPGATTPGGGAPPATPGPVDEVTGGPIVPRDPESARTLVADTTQGVTRELGRAVGQVSPEAGALVGQVGDGVADQLRTLPLPLSDGGR